MRRHARTQPRKDQHLATFLEAWQKTGRSSLLEEVTLLPCALPGTSLDQVDLTTTFLNKELGAPLMITGLTGGTPKTGEINKLLAQVAAHYRIPLGLGSQRAMLEDPATTPTFRVREVAPHIFLLANIGVAQLREAGLSRIQGLVDQVEADGLAVHLNVAQELMQPEGDRDFTGTWEALEKVINRLSVPVIVKGVGSGIDSRTGARLVNMGVAALDLAGVGGTSWPAMESARIRQVHALSGAAPTPGCCPPPGEVFRDWGIPTGANVMITRDLGVPIIASGGITNGLEGAKAIALGAHMAGMAGEVLRMLLEHGLEGALEFTGQVIEELRMATFLTGSLNVSQLRQAPKITGPGLAPWQDQVVRCPVPPAAPVTSTTTPMEGQGLQGRNRNRSEDR